MNTDIRTITRALQLAAALSIILFLVGCTRNSSDLKETIRFHKQNQSTLASAVADARKGLSEDVMRKRYPALCAKGFDFPKSLLIAEFTPINFYHVLVYVEDEAVLRNSCAMKDEGSVKRSLGGGWYVVQRGWM